MKTIKTVLGLLTCIYLLSACNISSKPSVDTPDFEKLVSDWDKAHNTKDVAAFSNLFDSSVFFYGTQMDKNACIESKLSLFKKYPDFYEQIFGEIQVENLNDSSVRCSFVKRVTVTQETKDYPAYLIFKKVGNDWKINTEGDLTTDKNLAKKTDGTISTETKTSLSSALFVSGLTSAKVFTSEQADKGSEYLYKDGRIFKIECFFNQVGIMFYSHNENNQRDKLDTKFEVGYTSDDEMVDLKKTSNFLIGQYDFDADDIDELIIAIQDNDEVDLSGITVNVFKLKNDKWNRIGVLTARGILGEPIAIVKMNTVKIERHLRGFYYQWTLESGKFKDTGDY